MTRFSDYANYEDYQDAMSEYDEDRLLDARMEAYDDEHPANMECEECGYEWYSRVLNQNSRVDPPEAESPDCPRCEGKVSWEGL